MNGIRSVPFPFPSLSRVVVTAFAGHVLHVLPVRSKEKMPEARKQLPAEFIETGLVIADACGSVAGVTDVEPLGRQCATGDQPRDMRCKSNSPRGGFQHEPTVALCVETTPPYPAFTRRINVSPPSFCRWSELRSSIGSFAGSTAKLSRGRPIGGDGEINSALRTDSPQSRHTRLAPTQHGAESRNAALVAIRSRFERRAAVFADVLSQGSKLRLHREIRPFVVPLGRTVHAVAALQFYQFSLVRNAINRSLGSIRSRRVRRLLLHGPQPRTRAGDAAKGLNG